MSNFLRFGDPKDHILFPKQSSITMLDLIKPSYQSSKCCELEKLLLYVLLEVSISTTFLHPLTDTTCSALP